MLTCLFQPVAAILTSVPLGKFDIAMKKQQAGLAWELLFSFFYDDDDGGWPLLYTYPIFYLYLYMFLFLCHAMTGEWGYIDLFNMVSIQFIY